MRFISRKLFDRLIVLEKGKVTNKLRNIRERHKKSLSMSAESVAVSSQDTWNVFSSSANEMYTVTLIEPSCTCTLICEYCKACIHKFNCTCIDACIKWNMCKHVHLVCRTIETKGTSYTKTESVNEDDDFVSKPGLQIEEEEEAKLKEKKCDFKLCREW